MYAHFYLQVINRKKSSTSKSHSNATSLRGPTTSRYYNQTPATTTTIPEAASAQQPQKQQQTTAIEPLSFSLSLHRLLT